MSKKPLVRVAARGSKLSRAQVEEVAALYPSFLFEVTYVETHGDKDRQSSLRTMDKSDFFTREVDELVLKGMCDLSVHSAKDLPEHIPDGLEVVEITQGVDTSDSLVIEGELKAGMVIATSTERREKSVLMLCSDIEFVEVRGSVEERLEVWRRGEIDGVVIAEAALIRLGLTHLPRITLPGEVAKMQGKLALVAKVGSRPFG